MSGSDDRTSVTPVPQARAIADIAFATQPEGADASRSLSWLAPEELDIDLDDPVQRRFGDYELVERIGHGGMGVVYRARQLGLDRDVALKLLSAGPWASEEFVARFRREARHAARMKHPNIVEIYEFGERDGLNFFSMRLVEGPSLAQRVARGGAMGEREAATCLRLLAEAMDYAHRLDVLHLDLKPANVLTGLGGEPLIADFGLARRVDATGLGAGEEISGTPSYMAPEQALLQSHPLTASTDIYGLGAILYELLTGQPPFAAGNAQATLERVVADPPLAPRQLRPVLSPDIEAICLKCLEKEPEARYATAHELADDLQRFIEGRPVIARPLGRRQRLLRWMGREPKLAIAVGCALLALTLGAGATALQWSRARQALADAELLGLASVLPSAGNSSVITIREQILAHLVEPERRATMRRLAKSANPRDWLVAGLVGDTLQKRSDLEQARTSMSRGMAALPADRFALIVALRYCEPRGVWHEGWNGYSYDGEIALCSMPDAAQRLAKLDPDNLFAWAMQIDPPTGERDRAGHAWWAYAHDARERARVNQQIARAARATKWDDGTRAILRAKVAAYGIDYLPIPTGPSNGRGNTADELRGSLSSEHFHAWSSSGAYLPTLHHVCNPELSTFIDAALRADCIRVMRVLADSKEGVRANIMGLDVLRLLGAGTPLGEEAAARLLQIQWLQDQQLTSRERLPVEAATQFTRDYLADGQLQANIRRTDRVAISRNPPAGWSEASLGALKLQSF